MAFHMKNPVKQETTSSDYVLVQNPIVNSGSITPEVLNQQPVLYSPPFRPATPYGCPNKPQGGVWLMVAIGIALTSVRQILTNQ